MNEAMPQHLWVVWRQDDAGNRSVVESRLTEEDARKLMREMEARGHKQVYWIEKQSIIEA